MGMRPVMNEARPAVQLAWPYQLVNTAPSWRDAVDVRGRMAEVRAPAIAPKSFQPVSSVISMTMLGFFCAYAGVAAAAAITATANSPAPSFPTMLFMSRHSLILHTIIARAVGAVIQ